MLMFVVWLQNGNIGFMLSCYDAQLCYDAQTDTFQARYIPSSFSITVILYNSISAPYLNKLECDGLYGSHSP